MSLYCAKCHPCDREHSTQTINFCHKCGRFALLVNCLATEDR